MRSQAWRLAAAAACSMAVLGEMPAHAGWGAELSRAVVTSVVRQYAYRLIQQNLYQNGRSQSMDDGRRSGYSQSNYGPSSAGLNGGTEQSVPSYTTHNAGSTTHHTHSKRQATVSATAHGSLRYPTDQTFIPPPPPFPTVYPGGADTSIQAGSSLSSKSTSQGSQLVPPPPPAPSIWNDLEPVSQVSAKPIAEQTASSSTKKSAGRTASSSASKLAAPALEAAGDADMPKAAPDHHHVHKVASHFQNQPGT